MMNSNVVTFTTFETFHLVDFIAMLQVLVKLVFCLNTTGRMKYKT